MIYDVFISYRGADRVLARKLEHRLRSRWGSRIFLDEQSLMAGQPWEKQLQDALKQARVMLALIGPGWEIRQDKQAEDWVREELLTAISLGMPILPVLVGNSDDLKPKLEALPAAFKRQAVQIGPELAGFDLHKVGKGLRDLGAFQREKSEQSVGLSLGRLEVAPPIALQNAKDYLARGRSLLVVGKSGSGRAVLLRKLIEELSKGDDLIATYGIERSLQPRRTHAVIASWIETLSSSIRQEIANGEDRRRGREVVHAVVHAGPDLLSRQVVRASTLLPLGTNEDDRAILEATRRPTERWAPFPPERLLSQSRSMLDELHKRLKRRLIFVVDNYDSVDDNSRELVLDLVQTIRDTNSQWLLILAVYDAQNPVSRELMEVMGFNTNHAAAKISGSRKPFDYIDVEDESAWVNPNTADNQHTALAPWLSAHRVELEPALLIIP